MDTAVFRDMRHRIGASQTTLAQMLGVHPVTVNKWEKGVTPISRVVELAMWALILFEEKERQARGLHLPNHEQSYRPSVHRAVHAGQEQVE